jgi:hypothetical protein
MSVTSRHHVVVMPTLEEDRDITAAAENDPDAPPLTAEQLRSMVVPLTHVRGLPRPVEWDENRTPGSDDRPGGSLMRKSLPKKN